MSYLIFMDTFTNNHSMEKNNLKKVCHVIAHDNPMEFMRMLNEFCKGKKSVWYKINSTPIVTGMLNTPSGPVAQMKIITSAYLEWECTEEDFASFIFEQKTLLK